MKRKREGLDELKDDVENKFFVMLLITGGWLFTKDDGSLSATVSLRVTVRLE